ncbi:glycerate kinase [Glutamicibacter halophytocola]|uniref:Glycerate kinase n=1 Tax=Glutamicibacter halophytocola TaxID=1933880 RepID=A0AA95BR23_9MICC|nr:glycerate kinase [Glutamicibacter halophytocola]UUX59875.1 glycerate kinase [Glutamicibacter halophytocola]
MPRFEANLDSGPSGVDLVITAKDAIDVQTPKGKVPALAGTLGRGCRDVQDVGIGAIASIMPIPMILQEAVARLSPRAAW